MNRFSALLLVFSTVFCVPLAFSAANTSSVSLLSQQLKTMESLAAQFQQQIKDSRGTLLQEASGTLTVKRPRRFHWRTEQPYEHLVVTDGVTLWLYDIDLEQISKQPFSADLDKAPALLLSGEVEQISRQYTVEILEQRQAFISFKLTPLMTDSVFKQLTISFNDKQLTAMSFHDNFDQITDITFSEVQLNPDINEQFFQFIPPAGVDIMTNES